MEFEPYKDIPVWLGVLSCIAGLAITIAMGKYVAWRDARKKEMQAKIVFEAQPARGKVHEQVLVRSK
jgi:hypothetical protein